MNTLALFVADSQRYLLERDLPVIEDTTEVLPLSVAFVYSVETDSIPRGIQILCTISFFFDHLRIASPITTYYSDLVRDPSNPTISLPRRVCTEVYRTQRDKTVQVEFRVDKIYPNGIRPRRAALSFHDFQIGKSYTICGSQ
jgi:hypothetical protein